MMYGLLNVLVQYIEKQPGKFVGDTSCEKLPVQVCGAGCTFQEGPQECHDKVIIDETIASETLFFTVVWS